MELFFLCLDFHNKMCGSLRRVRSKNTNYQNSAPPRRPHIRLSVYFPLCQVFLYLFVSCSQGSEFLPISVLLDPLIVSSRSNRNREGERENQRRSTEAGPGRTTPILDLPPVPLPSPPPSSLCWLHVTPSQHQRGFSTLFTRFFP